MTIGKLNKKWIHKNCSFMNLDDNSINYFGGKFARIVLKRLTEQEINYHLNNKNKLIDDKIIAEENTNLSNTVKENIDNMVPLVDISLKENVYKQVINSQTTIFDSDDESTDYNDAEDKLANKINVNLNSDVEKKAIQPFLESKAFYSNSQTTCRTLKILENARNSQEDKLKYIKKNISVKETLEVQKTLDYQEVATLDNELVKSKEINSQITIFESDDDNESVYDDALETLDHILNNENVDDQKPNNVIDEVQGLKFDGKSDEEKDIGLQVNDCISPGEIQKINEKSNCNLSDKIPSEAIIEQNIKKAEPLFQTFSPTTARTLKILQNARNSQQTGNTALKEIEQTNSEMLQITPPKEKNDSISSLITTPTSTLNMSPFSRSSLILKAAHDKLIKGNKSTDNNQQLISPSISLNKLKDNNIDNKIQCTPSSSTPGILKRKLPTIDLTSKKKRVLFADPVVSSELEIENCSAKKRFRKARLTTPSSVSLIITRSSQRAKLSNHVTSPPLNLIINSHLDEKE